MRTSYCKECDEPIQPHRGPFAEFCDACEAERKKRMSHRNDTCALPARWVVASAPPDTFRRGAEFDTTAFRYTVDPYTVFGGMQFHDRKRGDVVTLEVVLRRVWGDKK